MEKAKRLTHWSFGHVIAALALFLFTGCQLGKVPGYEMAAKTTAVTAAPASPAPVAAPVVTPAPAAAPAPAPVPPPVRIKAGPSDSFHDAEGNVWLPEQGFVDGETVERPEVEIANTKSPAIYRSERYSMTAFSYPVPNGKCTVKLHFAETFEGIEAPGQRVFSFNVEGQEFKDFDVWVKAGGPLRACIETVNVEVADGKLDISFTSNVENPEINGIEILPAP